MQPVAPAPLVVLPLLLLPSLLFGGGAAGALVSATATGPAAEADNGSRVTVTLPAFSRVHSCLPLRIRPSNGPGQYSLLVESANNSVAAAVRHAVADGTLRLFLGGPLVANTCASVTVELPATELQEVGGWVPEPLEGAGNPKCLLVLACCAVLAAGAKQGPCPPAASVLLALTMLPGPRWLNCLLPHWPALLLSRSMPASCPFSTRPGLQQLPRPAVGRSPRSSSKARVAGRQLALEEGTVDERQGSA